MPKKRGTRASEKSRPGSSTQPKTTDAEDPLAATPPAEEPIDSDDEYLQAAENDTGLDVNIQGLKNWKDLVKVLPGISSSKELTNWLRGEIFRPTWLRFYEGFLLPQQNRKKQITRGEDLATVIATIDHAKAIGNRKYQKEHPDTEDWQLLDWYCWLFHQLWTANETDGNGLFTNTPLTLDQRQRILWFLIVSLRTNFAVSRHQRGYSMLQISNEMKESFYDRFPILKTGAKRHSNISDSSDSTQTNKKAKTAEEPSQKADVAMEEPSLVHEPPEPSEVSLWKASPDSPIVSEIDCFLVGA
jgi:hypothetical protein